MTKVELAGASLAHAVRCALSRGNELVGQAVNGADAARLRDGVVKPLEAALRAYHRDQADGGDLANTGRLLHGLRVLAQVAGEAISRAGDHQPQVSGAAFAAQNYVREQLVAFELEWATTVHDALRDTDQGAAQPHPLAMPDRGDGAPWELYEARPVNQGGPYGMAWHVLWSRRTRAAEPAPPEPPADDDEQVVWEEGSWRICRRPDGTHYAEGEETVAALVAGDHLFALTAKDGRPREELSVPTAVLGELLGTEVARGDR